MITYRKNVIILLKSMFLLSRLVKKIIVLITGNVMEENDISFHCIKKDKEILIDYQKWSDF